jgi:ABC-type antimicrobial peptide transport system permease subunit
VTPLDRYVGASLARQKFLLWLIAGLAAMAVLLCIVGLYGVFSYSVTRRMREFGIRSAVGAQRRHLLNQVMAEGALVIVPGLAAGLGLAAGCSKLIATLLYRVSPTDSVSMALAASVILAAGLGSVVLPALRAMRADPAIVLREQ